MNETGIIQKGPVEKRFDNAEEKKGSGVVD
jgi:hypothetical protein